MSSSPSDQAVAPTETGDGAPYPQEGRERMLMPQPIAVVGTGAPTPRKGCSGAWTRATSS